MKEVILAKSAGFCFGVQRAMDTVYAEADKKNVYTYGPIIHNTEVVNELESKGVKAVNDISEIPEPEKSTVIIRSHGVSKAVYESIKNSGAKIVDATCPFVLKIHKIVKDASAEGDQIVIIGNEKHPEVEGIMGLVNSHMTTNMVVNNVMSMDARKIEHTLKSFDTASFDMAVEDIMAAESVYIIGARSCEPLAEFFGYYLRLVKKNVQVVKTGNTNELFEQMVYIGEGDVAIGISFPRYSMRTLKAMEFANNRKARVIAITDSVHSPMNMYSSCNLFARSDMASIVDSLVAPMSLINALIVSICLKNSEQVVENIEKINTFVDNFEYSGNDEINMLDENVVNELRKCMDNAAIDEEK